MIMGIGVDMVDVDRMVQLAKRHPEQWALRLFTESERAYCNTKSFPYPYYAARFAAKEAFFKALGTGLSTGMSWQDVEVCHDEKSAPFLRCTGKTQELMKQKGVSCCHVSLSHTDTLATAFVVLS